MTNLTRELAIQKWFFIVAMPLGLAVPLTEGFDAIARHGAFRSDSGGATVLIGLPALAMLLAGLCGWWDYCGKRDAFWQSRPVSTRRILTIRLLTASVLMGVCAVAITAPDMVFKLRGHGYSYTYGKLAVLPGREVGWNIEAWTVMVAGLALAIMLFSLTSWLMALTRNLGRSVNLALWAAAMLVALPVLLGWPDWINGLNAMMERAVMHKPGLVGTWVLNLSGHPARGYESPRDFIAYRNFMIVIGLLYLLAILFHALCIRAVERHTRYVPGQKTLMWSLGGSVVLVLVIFTAQLGNNLKPVETLDGIELPQTISTGHGDLSEQVRHYLFEDKDPKQWRTRTFGERCALIPETGQLVRFRGVYLRPENRDDYDSNATPLDFAYELRCFESPDALAATAQHPVDTLEVIGELAQTPRIKKPAKELSHYLRIKAMTYHRGRLYILRKNDFAVPPENNSHDPDIRDHLIQAFDLSDIRHPRLLGEVEVAECDKLSAWGDYLYLPSMEWMQIVSTADPSAMALSRRIDMPRFIATRNYIKTIKDLQEARRQAGEPEPTIEEIRSIKPESDLAPGPANPLGVPLAGGRYPYMPASIISQDGDRLMLCDGKAIMILSLSDPLSPRVIYQRDMTQSYQQPPSDTRIIEAILLVGNHGYLGSELGIETVEFREDAQGNLQAAGSGFRSATPLERLAGRRPGELSTTGRWLIEDAQGFGLIVYDISEPLRPRRHYHQEYSYYPTWAWPWRGMIYRLTGKLELYKLPE